MRRVVELARVSEPEVILMIKWIRTSRLSIKNSLSTRVAEPGGDHARASVGISNSQRFMVKVYRGAFSCKFLNDVVHQKGFRTNLHLPSRMKKVSSFTPGTILLITSFSLHGTEKPRIYLPNLKPLHCSMSKNEYV